MAVRLDLKQEVRDAFDKLRSSRTANHCIFCKPVTDTLSIDFVEEHPEGMCLDDAADEIPENEPFFIITMPERTHRDGRKSYPIVLIAYCPPGLPPQTNIVFSNARVQLAKDLQIQKVWSVKKTYQLGDDEMAEKLETNKW